MLREKSASEDKGGLVLIKCAIVGDDSGGRRAWDLWGRGVVVGVRMVWDTNSRICNE